MGAKPNDLRFELKAHCCKHKFGRLIIFFEEGWGVTMCLRLRGNGKGRESFKHSTEALTTILILPKCQKRTGFSFDVFKL